MHQVSDACLAMRMAGPALTKMGIGDVPSDIPASSRVTSFMVFNGIYCLYGRIVEFDVSWII